MPSIVGLDWDADDDPEGNAQHIARHNVTPAEVREVLEGAPDFLPVDTEGPNPCYVAVGFTAGGRLLEVWGIHFQGPPLAGFWHTITAMDARPAHRKRYLGERGARRRGDRSR